MTREAVSDTTGPLAKLTWATVMIDFCRRTIRPDSIVMQHRLTATQIEHQIDIVNHQRSSTTRQPGWMSKKLRQSTENDRKRRLAIFANQSAQLAKDGL